MSEFENLQLTCTDPTCGKRFVWTAGEQEFLNDLKEKGKIPSVSQPKRCQDCRIKNKRKREERQ